MPERYDAVIVGLGESGYACARYLAAQGRRIAITDSRAQPPRLADTQNRLPDVPLILGGFDAELLQRADEIIVSPGVDRRESPLAEAAASGTPVCGEIELFARAARAPVVVVTGSNGKSTVTTLVGEMAAAAGLDAAVGGNLGTPALDLLRSPEPEIYVLELSSFQLETVTSLNAAAAVVLNISPDHLDRYATLDAYASAKRRAFRGDGVMVVNRDDPAVAAMAEAKRTVLTFGLGEPGNEAAFGIITMDGQRWLARGDRRIVAADDLPVAGDHNLANALAALALAAAGGIPEAPAVAALREFRGLPHRMEFIRETGGVAYFNDSKGTNVGATVAAVNGLQRPVVLIAGGQGKGQDFSALADALRGRARGVVLMGEDAPALAEALGDAVPVSRAVDMEDAVRRAAALASPGDAVVLSPACASFDMFAGYEARGEAFRHAVEGLGHG
jgi:UDP-N-acetylmuramoylalanine--D-glutamate ligase